MMVLNRSTVKARNEGGLKDMKAKLRMLAIHWNCLTILEHPKAAKTLSRTDRVRTGNRTVVVTVPLSRRHVMITPTKTRRIVQAFEFIRFCFDYILQKANPERE